MSVTVTLTRWFTANSFSASKDRISCPEEMAVVVEAAGSMLNFLGDLKICVQDPSSSSS